MIKANSKTARRLGLLLTVAALGMAQTMSIDHSKWKLTQRGRGQIPADTHFTLTFDHGQISIAGCNLLAGKFHTEGQTLLVPGPLRSTRKACADGSEKLDDALSQLIAGRPQYSLAEDQLSLTSNQGVRWVFSREPYPSRNSTTKFLYVAAFTKDCTGVAPMKCLQIRDSKDEPWKLNYIPIQGFEHIPGIEYRLRIKEDKVARPPADSASVAWYLDMVVEQTVVDRQAAEDYEREKHKQ